MNTNPAVQADKITKRFGDFVAVNNISFEVHAGEIFGFLGPNGSGKTTTIRMILGLLQPTAGRIMVLGQDVAAGGEAASIRRRVGYMSQRFSLYPELTVAENLRFFARAYGVTGERFRQREAEILRMAGLEGRQDQQTGTLAGGWKQRLALGAAILHEPEILFLDEPTAGVDPISRRAFWDLLYDLAAAGTTIFVTTHYMDEAEHCHRLAFIYRGEIIAQGAPTEVRRAGLQGQVLEIDCREPERAMVLLREASAAGLLVVHELAFHGALIHAIGESATTLAAAVSQILSGNGILVESIEPVESSLEDVFVSLVKRQRKITGPESV
ncbi:MAG: ABC transporter ATP-binding protein [Chloroflexota bacterium]|nr:ABC transporter ATP-binding protein [Chloroflexota bacterium]